MKNLLRSLFVAAGLAALLSAPAGATVYEGLFNGTPTTGALPYADGTNPGQLDNSEIVDSGGGATVGSPTGGAKGAGTLNATGLFINGSAVGTGGSGTVSNCSTADALAYYAATGTTASCLSGVGTSGQGLISGGAGVAPAWTNVPGLAVQNTWTAGQAVTPSALTDAATIAVNAALSNGFTVTLGGNRTMGNPSNLIAGQHLEFAITQDGTGSRTLAWSSEYKWAGGTAPTLTTAAAATDVVSCWAYTSALLSCSASLNVH